MNTLTTQQKTRRNKVLAAESAGQLGFADVFAADSNLQPQAELMKMQTPAEAAVAIAKAAGVKETNDFEKAANAFYKKVGFGTDKSELFPVIRNYLDKIIVSDDLHECVYGQPEAQNVQSEESDYEEVSSEKEQEAERSKRYGLAMDEIANRLISQRALTGSVKNISPLVSIVYKELMFDRRANTMAKDALRSDPSLGSIPFNTVLSQVKKFMRDSASKDGAVSMMVQAIEDAMDDIVRAPLCGKKLYMGFTNHSAFQNAMILLFDDVSWTNFCQQYEGLEEALGASPQELVTKRVIKDSGIEVVENFDNHRYDYDFLNIPDDISEKTLERAQKFFYGKKRLINGYH